MIADDERVNGEFYVAPVYNRLIAAGQRSPSTMSGASSPACTGSAHPPTSTVPGAAAPRDGGAA